MIPEIMDIIIRVLSVERDKAREVVEAIIDSEQNYLFTNDQDYRDNRSEIVANPGQQQIGPDGQPMNHGQPNMPPPQQ